MFPSDLGIFTPKYLTNKRMSTLDTVYDYNLNEQFLSVC